MRSIQYQDIIIYNNSNNSNNNNNNNNNKQQRRTWTLIKFIVIPILVLEIYFISHEHTPTCPGAVASPRAVVSKEILAHNETDAVPWHFNTSDHHRQQQHGEDPPNHDEDAKRKHRDSFLSLVKGARHCTGNWVGDVWIPPRQWRLLSTAELQEFYSSRSMVWIGDSTGRRTSLMMFEMLLRNVSQGGGEEEDEKEILYLPQESINNDSVISGFGNAMPEAHTCPPDATRRPFRETQVCRDMPQHRRYPRRSTAPGAANASTSTNDDLSLTTTTVASGMMRKTGANGKATWNRYMQMKYLFLFAKFLRLHQIRMGDFDVVVVSIGIWDVVRDRDKLETVTYENRVQQALSALDAIQQEPALQHTKIVWRTSGFWDRTMDSMRKLTDSDVKTRRINQAVMKGIEEIAERHLRNGVISNITCIDWGGAIEPRSFGNDRIQGDMPAHYGFMPRYVAIQMLTNHLMDLERFHPQQY